MFTGAQIQGMSRSGTQWHAKARGRALFPERPRPHAWVRVGTRGHSFSMVPNMNTSDTHSRALCLHKRTCI